MAGRRGAGAVQRTLRVALLVFGLTVVSAFLSASFAVDTPTVIEDEDIELRALDDSDPSGIDVRQTCADLRTQIDDWFDVSPTEPLPLEIPGFELDPLAMGDATVTLNCGLQNFMTFEGPVTIDGHTYDVTVGLTWPTAGAAFPTTVDIDLDGAGTIGNPLFSVADAVGWLADLTGTSGFDAGPLGGADLELRDLVVDFQWKHEVGTTLDATARVIYFQGDTAEISDDLDIGLLLSITAPEGEDPTLLAGMHIANTVDAEDTFTLGGILRGAPGDLATSIELPEMYLATVQPAGHTVPVTSLRPVAKAFFEDDDTEVEGLPEKNVGEPFEFDSTVTIVANANLDSLGDGPRQAFGYAEGAKVTAVGKIGLSFADINSATPTVDFEGVDIDILLPDLDGDNAALLPDWAELANMKINVAWDQTTTSLLVEADADATVEIADPTQPGGVVDIVVHLSSQFMFVTELDNTSTFTLAFRGEAVEDPPGTAVWPTPFGLDWLSLLDFGAEIVFIAPENQPLTISGQLTARVELSGEIFEFTAKLDSDDAGTTVILNLALHSEITLTELVDDFLGVDLPSIFDGLSAGPVPEDDPDGPGPLEPPPLSITARLFFPTGSDAEDDIETYFAINAPLTINFTDEPDAGLRMAFLFSFRTGDTEPVVTVGGLLRDTSLYGALGGVLPPDLVDMLPDSFDFDLPALGVVFTSGTIDTSSAELAKDAPEEHEFFRHLYGCGGTIPDPDCAFDVELTSGVHFLSSIELPDDAPAEPGDEPRPMFAAVFDAIGMDGDNPPPVLLQLSTELGGDGGLGAITMRMVLPIRPAAPPDWFHAAKMAVSFSIDPEGPSLSVKLLGALDLRLEDESKKTEAACDAAGGNKRWLARVDTDPAQYVCYDIVAFELDTSLSLGTGGVSITLTGRLLSVGWNPFGIEWLTVNGAALQLSVTVDASGQPQFNLGLFASGGLFNKDFSGSILIGVRIVPAAPSPIPVPDFKGISLASQAGLELADIVNLYDFLKARAEMLAEAANEVDVPGFDPPDITLPPLDIDLDALPNVSVRNLTLNVGLVDNDALCIDLGLKMSGQLYINAEPIGALPLPAEDGCPPPLPSPEECLNFAVDPCFAAAEIQATLEGIIVSGGLGAFDVGPLHWDQALLDFRLTPTIQRLRVYGGAEIDAVGSGEVDLAVAINGFAFLGDIHLYGPGDFRALVEGEASVNLAPDAIPNVFEDPAALLDVGFYLHALLQGDFGAMMQQTVGPPLQLARDGAASLLATYEEIKATDGDVIGTLVGLPAALREHDVEVPPWLDDPDPDATDLLSLLADMQAFMEDNDIDSPTLETILTGIPIETPGLPGVWVPEDRECHQVVTVAGVSAVSPTLGAVDDGDCWTVLPGDFFFPDGVAGVWIDPVCTSVVPLTTAVVSGDNCWSIAPGEFTFGGLCQVVDDIPCDLSDFLELYLEPPLVEVLNALGIPGDDFTTMVDRLLDGAPPGAPPLALHCADFELDTRDEPSFSLRLDASVFSERFGFDVDWDFAAAPGDQALALFEELMGFFMDGGDPAECEPLGTITVAGGGRGIATSVDAILAPPIPDSFSIASSAAVIDEGQSLTVTATFTGAWDDTDPITVQWGDGTTTDSTVAAMRAGVSHPYGDDATPVTSTDAYAITVTGGDLVETTAVVVRNVAPSGLTAATPSGTTITEGTSVSFSGTFTDPGDEAAHTVTIDWGDNTAKTVITLADGERAWTAPHVYVDDNPTATSSDVYWAKVTVADDDSGSATTTTKMTVHNAPPANITITPVGVTQVLEGNVVSYDVTFTDPGTKDTHDVSISWGDGTSVTTAKATPAQPLRISHRFVDDNPSHTTHDPYSVSVSVTDDDTGTATAPTSIDVANVAPSVLVSVTPASVVENSNGLVTVRGRISDPGAPSDIHTVTIDWGYSGFTATTIAVPSGTTTFEATKTFGDDGVFSVTASVTDDDMVTNAGTLLGGVTAGSASRPATVTNANPTATIDESGAVAVDGGVTFIVRRGSALTLGAVVADVGSDDVRLRWDWDATDRFVTSTSSSPWYLAAGGTGAAVTDPDPSPDVDPTTSPRSTAVNTFVQPCRYLVTATAEDDDAGTGTDTIWVVVTGSNTQRQITGWWYQQYLDGIRNKTDIDDVPTLSCYLEIVGHMSKVFGDDDVIPLATAANARTVLDPAGPSDDTATFDRQLLAAWLNFSHGAVRWTDVVDTDCNKKADTAFSTLMQGAETLRTSAAPSKSQLIAYKTRLECVNSTR